MYSAKVTIHIYFLASLVGYNQKIQEICTQCEQNKIASKGKSQYLVWPPFAQFKLFVGDWTSFLL